MSSTSIRWPLAGILAGTLCFALSAPPAIADSKSDKSDSGTKSKNEVRVYSDGDDDDSGVRVYRYEGDDDDATPGSRKEIRVYSDGDDEDAKVPGGYLGVRVQDITRELQKAKDLPNTSGALIARVESDSPASRGGVQRGDVIVEVDHHQIDDASELTRRVGDLEPGSKAQVIVLRNGMRKTLTITVGKRPKDFAYMTPRRVPMWTQHMDGDMPMPPDLGEQLDRIRVYRQDVQRQLSDIQEQLSRLREGDLQRLEDEIRALRDELRARDDHKSGGSD